jgi:hypothetical protein
MPGEASNACLGTDEQVGIFVTGSIRPGFPSESERLLLNVAANEAESGYGKLSFSTSIAGPLENSTSKTVGKRKSVQLLTTN